jgi:hypothetical protein
MGGLIGDRLMRGIVKQPIFLLVLCGLCLASCFLEHKKPHYTWAQTILALRLAFMAYHYGYGSLPYDPRGMDYALYKIEDDNIEGDKKVICTCYGRPPWRIDNVNKKVIALRVDYLNPSPSDLLQARPEFIILAVTDEKEEPDSIQVLSSKDVQYTLVRTRTTGHDRLVGKTMEDVERNYEITWKSNNDIIDFFGEQTKE